MKNMHHKQTIMKKVLTISFFLLLFWNSSAQIPPIYAGLGYNFGRSPLIAFNDFIELYNQDPHKTDNYVFPHGFDKMHWLTGVCFSGGIYLTKSTALELSFSRKFNHTFAYYDPANNPTNLRVDIGIGVATIESALLFPTKYDKLTNSPSIGFAMRKNYYFDR
jgi:hypothetical protein